MKKKLLVLLMSTLILGTSISVSAAPVKKEDTTQSTISLKDAGSSYEKYGTLSVGSSGWGVYSLQCDLNTIGSYINNSDMKCSRDSQFGPETKKAVIAFQNHCNLTPDGIVGPATWEAIDWYIDYWNLRY